MINLYKLWAASISACNSMVKTCQANIRIMLLDKYYSEFAPVPELQCPFFSRPNFISKSHAWRHERVHWCITLRRIPVMLEIWSLGWLLNITINHERILNSKLNNTFVWVSENKSKNFCPSLYWITTPNDWLLQQQTLDRKHTNSSRMK